MRVNPHPMFSRVCLGRSCGSLQRERVKERAGVGLVEERLIGDNTNQRQKLKSTVPACFIYFVVRSFIYLPL